MSTKAGGLHFGLLLLVGGAVPEAVTVLALTAFWFVGRLRVIDEPGVAGRFLRRRETVELLQTIALSVLLLTVIAVTFAGAFAGWGRGSEGRVLFGALGALMLYLQRDICQRFDVMDRLRVGSESEEAVGKALETLRMKGWEVIDDWRREDGRGNVDHAVRGPRGAFAIETKSGPYRTRYLGQAVSNAIWLRQKWRARWVTAVICVNEPGRSPSEEVVGKSTAWVVDRRDLATWLSTYAR